MSVAAPRSQYLIYHDIKPNQSMSYSGNAEKPCNVVTSIEAMDFGRLEPQTSGLDKAGSLDIVVCTDL